MKKFATVGLVLSLIAGMFVSCSECYEKMQKKQDQIQVTCVPEVLTLKGSVVSTEMTVSFPENYFNAETILKITPVLVYNGGELVGTPKYVQGEDVVGNYTAISRFEGGSYTQRIEFPFVKEALMGTLELRIESKCYDDCKETPDFVAFTTIAVSKGISALQNLAKSEVANVANNAAAGVAGVAGAAGAAGCGENCDGSCGHDHAEHGHLAILGHNFQRSSTSSQQAEILYQINSSTVRKNQLTQEQIQLFKDFVANNSAAERTTLSNVYASGYASPDGPEKFNNELSEKRSKTGAKAMQKELKKVKGLTYEIASYGEDWDGFKTLVENSNIEEKDLILNVLQMYSSPVERDKEIQNMSAVFKVLAEEILPQLRRTRFAVEATYAGLTDEEILAAAKAGDNSLDIEHLLYAATLTNNYAEKAAIYEFAAATYHDARAYNNLGVAKVYTGDLNGAKTAFEKSSQMAANSEVANNLATVAIAMGDLEAAKQYLNGVESEAAKANMAAIALAEGNYQEAKASLKGYNLAVAELCDNNIEGAKAAIAEVKGADADYIRAIIANREGDTAKAVAYLKSAVAAKPELKAQAENDIEFYQLLQENAL